MLQPKQRIRAALRQGLHGPLISAYPAGPMARPAALPDLTVGTAAARQEGSQKAIWF